LWTRKPHHQYLLLRNYPEIDKIAKETRPRSQKLHPDVKREIKEIIEIPDAAERRKRFELLNAKLGTSSLDVKYQIDGLRKLKDGWLDGKGSALPADGLDRLAINFEMFFPEELQLPYLYPTAEGGVQAEWKIGDFEMTLEIDLTTNQGYWHALNMKTEAENTRNLNLNNEVDWVWINKQIQEMTKAGAV
jgi:hypothetical protein